MTEADFIATLRAHWLRYGSVLNTGGMFPVLSLQFWEDDEGEPDPPVPYHRCTIRSAGAQAMTVGRGREETRGLVTVQVFTPSVDGPGPAERLASSVATVWRTFRDPRVRLSAPAIAGLSRQGAFNRQLVSIGWRADLRPAQA